MSRSKTDLWYVTDKTKVAPARDAYAIRFTFGVGHESLEIDLGPNESDARHSVAAIRRALDALVTSIGGE
ncbi:MAG: hypothetical protein ABIO65_05290 [Nitrospiria bacterium]